MMGPGNSSVSPSNPGLPLLASALSGMSAKGMKGNTSPSSRDATRRAIARRLAGKSPAIEAGKLDNMPDDKVSFESI